MRVFKKNGLKYIDEGTGQEILFLHGWGISPYSYKRVIDNLASNHRIIAPLITVKQTSFEEVKNLFKQEKIIVIGHSAGGLYAANFCSRFPNSIKSLILIDSLGFPDSKVDSSKRWLKHGLNILLSLNTFSLILIKDFLNQLLRNRRLLEEGVFVIKEKLDINPNFPVLILWGEQDDLVPVQNGYELQKIIKGSKLKVVKGGHYWFLKDPILFEKELRGFIN